MAFIKQVKTVEKSAIKIPVSKNLSDSFTKELEIYIQNNSANNSLDFDPLVKKLIKELSTINSASTKSK